MRTFCRLGRIHQLGLNWKGWHHQVMIDASSHLCSQHLWPGRGRVGPRPPPPGAGDHGVGAAAGQWRSGRVGPRPGRGQQRRQMVRARRLIQAFASQRTHLPHVLPVLLLLLMATLDLLRAPARPVEAGRPGEGVHGELPLLVGHGGDAEVSRRAVSLWHGVGVPRLRPDLPLGSAGHHRSSERPAASGGGRSAGPPVLRPPFGSDGGVRLHHAGAVPHEEPPGVSVLRLLHMADPADALQRPQHVLEVQTSNWSPAKVHPNPSVEHNLEFKRKVQALLCVQLYLFIFYLLHLTILLQWWM